MRNLNRNKILSAEAEAGHGHLRAGVAKSDITTDEKGVKIKDPLYAKALVLDDGKTKVVIIAMDVTAIGGRKISQGMLPDVGEEFLPNLRSRIQKELKIPGCNVLVNASHTHPPGRMLCSDDEQVDRTFDAVRRAMENMVEVKVGSGKGQEKRISMNRTLRLKDGSHWTIRHTNPSPPEDEVESLGPIDTEIGIIRIDRMDGRPLAAVYNFACHPLFGDEKGRITANFPAYASKVIEESLDNSAMALFLQGAAGDVCDVNFKDFSQPRNIEILGRMLGVSTLEAFRKIKTGTATLNVISGNVILPRRKDIPRRIKSLLKEQQELLESLRFTTLNFKSFMHLYSKYELNAGQSLSASTCKKQSKKSGHVESADMDSLNRRNIQKYLKNIRAMERLARVQDDIATLTKHQEINEESGEDTVESEVQGVRIGNCVLITAPFEALVEIGLRIKKASPFKNTFMAAYSNGYLHYGAPADDYDKGGYEVTECMLAPEWQGIYERKANEIICKL